jgi:two-component system response regulator YesN
MYKVVIVDDETSVKRSLKSIIERENPAFEVIAFAENGQEALAIIGKSNPDLVITDIRMPVMDGLTLVQEIRRCAIPTDVVIISGYNEFDYAREALRYGVTDFLLKPVDVEEVTKTLSLAERKLREKKAGWVERSEWIAFCKTEAEIMAKHLWVLNETAVWNELEQLRLRLQRDDPDFVRVKEMYVHLIFLLQAEMAKLSGNRVQIQPLPEYEWNGQEDMLEVHVRLILQSAMKEVRSIRNWGSHKSMAEAVKQIENNFTNESFSLRDAAELARMSPTYFSKSFKEETGMSFTQYIAKLRMEKSIELLSVPDNKVYEVAFAVGYSDYAHFAKVFKKYFQFSPTDYRNRLDASALRKTMQC